MSQIVRRQPRVPIMFDQPGCGGQQPAKRPILCVRHIHDSKPSGLSDLLLSMLSKRWVGLVFISLGVALIIVDSTIVNVAIPSIINDIGITSTQAQWVQEIYTLVFAALLLVGGRLADQWPAASFLLGTVIFAGASVLAALAGDGTQLIAARAVQGLGGRRCCRPRCHC